MKALIQIVHNRQQVSMKMINEEICRGRIMVRIVDIT